MLLLCAECSKGDLVLLYKLDDISIQAECDTQSYRLNIAIPKF